jgi:hemolysin activation/secretion protein
VSIVLRGVSFTGNTLYSSETLAAFAADRIGQAVSLAELEQIAGRITEHYRRDGWFLAQAVVPGQDVTSGRVEISILEGRLGKIRVNRAPEAPIRDRVLQGILSALEPGKPIHQAGLERTVMLLSDLPGLKIQSSLESGEEPGTSDLAVDVDRRRRWDASVDADNHGSRYTGEYRLGVLGRINSPLELGDNLDLRLLTSSGGGLTFGRIGYELPVGYAGTRAGVAVGRLDYQLGKEFAPLGANGQAEFVELSATHPFVRARDRNLFGRLGLDEKRLEDRVDALGSRSDKRVRNLGLGLAFEGRDALLGGGYASAGATLYLGELSIRSAADLAFDQSPAGRRTNGSFTRLAYQASRLQSLVGPASLFLGAAGQFASKNLDSIEKIALGGPRGVRAYPSSEAVADEGHVVNAELRYSASADVTLSGFYDFGWAKLNRDPSPADTDNKRSLRGYGLGVFWTTDPGLTLRASLAWRDSAASNTDLRDRVPRLYVQMIKSF